MDFLTFIWTCPPEFTSLCLSTKSSLTLKSSEYSINIPVPTEAKTYDIKLTIKKDRRSATKEFKIYIRKPLAISNKKSESLDILELIVINPLSRGGSPEILIGVSFLDKNLNIFDYSYMWAVTHFKNEAQYLNGRREASLKILNEDLLTGYNEFKIEVTDKTGKTYLKSYSYEKSRAPYGGSCVVSPSVGTSMKTEFKFKIQG